MKKNLSNETYLQTVWRRFRHHHLAVVSIVVVAVISLAAVLAPILAPYEAGFCMRHGFHSWSG